MVKRIIITLFLAIAFCSAYNQIPSGYYDSANGLTGDALKSALNDIIDGHTEISYTAAKEALKETDEDPLNSNNVICLYTGWSYPKNDFGNGSEDWNREHTWSKSHGDFGDSPPAGTDIHHLRPADASVNSSKNNRDFHIGTTQYIDGSGPTDCYKDTDIWEPRDNVKGDVARMIFYMATRYEGENGEVDLEIVDYVNTTGGTYEPYYGKLSTLLSWHNSDPVDSWEINRNSIIYSSYQGNRNPYIDHPEYVNSVWGTTNPEPSNQVVSFTTPTLAPTSITLTWNDNDGTNEADKFLILINTTGTFATPIDGAEQNDDTDYSDGIGQANVSHNTETYTLTGLSASTTYYMEIYPYTNFGLNIDYKTDGTIPSTNGLTNVSNTYLFISEVTHPSDAALAKFIEIYNGGNTSIDFNSEIWYISRQSNGGTTWGNMQLTGSLAAKDTYVISNDNVVFHNNYGFYADINSSTINGNGNDGYFLYSGGDHNSGILIDAYGVIDQNGTGTGWEYTNSKAVRKGNDTIPSQTWQSAQWVIHSAANHEKMTPDWHRKELIWTGLVSDQWEANTNWNIGMSVSDYAPDASCKITIPFISPSPVITSEESCDYLDIDAGATIFINLGTLSIGH